jgi:transposase
MRERTRYWQRLEKLLEDSLIKVSAVASRLDTLSVRDMLEALIAGERDPKGALRPGPRQDESQACGAD